MRKVTLLILIACLVSLACTNKHPRAVAGRYLQGAVNTATKDDVIQHLGPPASKNSLSDGREVWSYRWEEAHSTQGSGFTDCSMYLVTFDQKGILRNYERKNC